MYRLRFVALTAILLPIVSSAAETKGEKPLLAGAATANITPWLGGGLVGNFGTPPPAKYVHDELHARCFVLDDGDTRIALVVIDNIGIGREVLDEAKRQVKEATGLPTDRILISCTHTHSSVSIREKNPGQSKQSFSAYQQLVTHRIADGVQNAIHNLQPARVAWGTVDLPGQVFCRRWLLQPGSGVFNPFGELEQVMMNPGNRPDLLEPACPIDPQIAFLAIETSDGRPLGLLANYSLHYVGGTDRNDISADYFGMFCDRVQELLAADRLDPPFVAAMSNGTSGNINNNDYSKRSQRREPYEKMRLVADQCAHAVCGEYQKLRWHDRVPLDMRQQELELAARKPTAAQLEHARKVMADPDHHDAFPHERSYAQGAIQLQNSPDTIRIILQAVKIGDLGISAIPFEVFTETGLELKAANPFKPSFTMGLANGSYGYLPTPEQHRLGGYETWLGTNTVELQATVKIVDNLLKLLTDLAETP